MLEGRKKIYMCLAHMSGMEKGFIDEAFETNWVVPLGPNVNGFEADLEQFMQEHVSVEDARLREKRVCALSSGTAAVHLGLIDVGVRAGDEVICQSLTFCASVNPVTYLGAKPILIDSEPLTYNMDPYLVERAIQDRIAQTGRCPKAIILVHLYGMPAQVDRIMEIADRYDIPVMEDAAEALGSMFRGRMCGTFGQYGVWSFNGNKMITTSGGGALICPNEESRRNAIFYATQAKEPTPYYQHEVIGFNYRLSNICAGIGRGQMTVLREHIAHHRHVHALYVEAFRDVPGIKVHSAPSADYDSNYWLSTILIDEQVKIRVDGKPSSVRSVPSEGGQPNDNVEQLRVLLDEKGIESRAIWKPMHCMPVYTRDATVAKVAGGVKGSDDCYASAGYKALQGAHAIAYVNGVSEGLFRRGLCLPSGPCVSDEDVRYIVDCIKEAMA